MPYPPQAPMEDTRVVPELIVGAAVVAAGIAVKAVDAKTGEPAPALPPGQEMMLPKVVAEAAAPALFPAAPPAPPDGTVTVWDDGEVINTLAYAPPPPPEAAALCAATVAAVPPPPPPGP